jgi:hypothetical protein
VQAVFLQLYGSNSRFRTAFNLDDADFLERFYTQSGSANFDVTWLADRYRLQNSIENSVLDALYAKNKDATISPATLKNIVEGLANATGKKLHALPLFDPLRSLCPIITAPPSMHNCMAILKKLLDVMIKFCIPIDCKELSKFGKFLAGAASTNAHGQITASVATYRKLIKM